MQNLSTDLLYNKIFNSSVAAIGITDLQGKYTAVNPAWCEFTGYSREEAMNLNLQALTPLLEQDSSEENFSRLINREIPSMRLTRRYLRKDGTIFWADLSVSVITDTDDNVCGLLGVFVNIDPQKKAEMELRETNGKLSQANLELQHAFKELEKLARHDPLTGLYNRRVIDNSLAYEIERSKRGDKGLSVALGDIDHFKLVNDTYGHECGDMVLKELSRVMRESLRLTDVVGRWGGEEFLFILPEADCFGAGIVIERIRKAVSDLELSWKDKPIEITLSFGISHHKGEVKRQDIVDEADKALYRAKRDGRDRVYCYQEMEEN
jgi:diguanylate cyclase (GGDEF)-like protein/PAS domain S-box-containing protein